VFSETLVAIYHITWRHIPRDSNLRNDRYENLTFRECELICVKQGLFIMYMYLRMFVLVFVK
jgi:hypothetical protein